MAVMMANASKGRPSGSSAYNLLMKIYTTMTSGDWPTDGGAVISFAVGDFKNPVVREIDVKIAPQEQRQHGPIILTNPISVPAQSITVNASIGQMAEIPAGTAMGMLVQKADPLYPFMARMRTSRAQSYCGQPLAGRRD
jgi:hypothetical protein